MEVNIQGHGVELSQPLRDYAFNKITRLREFFKNIQRIQITLDARDIDEFKRGQVAEVSMWMAGKRVIRASESGQDMYAAIDLVFEELERQIIKHKEKHVKEVRREAEKFKHATRTFTPQNPVTGEPVLAKLKRFNIVNMTQDEARAEQEKLGHDFFLFRNAETGEINVLHQQQISAPPSLKSLDEQEAVRQLKSLGADFLAFINSGTSELNIIYKRKSGNLGLIEPSL